MSRFFRWCDKCGKRFTPTGKYQKVCDSCIKLQRQENFKKMLCLTNARRKGIRL